MQAIVRSNEIEEYKHVRNFFYWLDDLTKEREGYIYYKYPISTIDYEQIPDIVIADKYYGMTIILNS